MPGNRAQITTLNDGIVAVDTEYLRPIQDASHLITEGGRGAFVDTGANSSVPMLLDALRQRDLNVGDIDFVFLTHIHLDHAGGAGLLMQHLPNARCVLHPRGAPHMVNPERLIAGTIGVYGEEKTHEMYGEIVPIDESRVVVARCALHPAASRIATTVETNCAAIAAVRRNDELLAAPAVERDQNLWRE